MSKKKRYTARYLIGLGMLPFLIVGYFFRKYIWSYLTKKKPFVEWVIVVLGITVVILAISGLLRGDFKPGKEAKDLSPAKLKHR